MEYLLCIAFGMMIGALAFWGRCVGVRRDLNRIDEKYQRLNQEKQIVSGFTHNLADGMGEDLDHADLMQRIARNALLGTGALSSCIFEREGDRLRSVAVEGLFPPQKITPHTNPARYDTRAKYLEYILRSEIYEMGEGIIGSSAKECRAVLVENAESDPRIVQSTDPALRVRSLIAAPMLYRKRVMGVLAVANPSDGSFFNQGDLSLIQSFAEQAALLLHNATLMKTQIEKNKLDFDLAIASSIQGFLLPNVFPKIPKLAIDALYRPALQVGGDLFDAFEIDEHKVGLVIADVSGKGVAASLLMAICQTHLRHCFRDSASPAEVLRRVNRLMALEVHPDMFITITYAVVDAHNDTITFARAGHELPLLFHAGAVEKVGSEGMALGMVPPAMFDRFIQDKTIPFKKGDLFCLYTDGATEAPAENDEEFGLERFVQTVRDNADKPPAEINAALLARVKSFSKRPALPDDFTVITVAHL